jgi:O-antigen/teichoic acid export membrane protein
MAFPVLARAAGNDEMLALRRRMVIVLTTVLFPLLVLLALLAPTLVPWLFGPLWEPAVVPTQILAAGGAATLVIDAVGSAVMAQGRSKALLGYGVAHFAVYAGAVFAVASRGLVAVAIAAAVVHAVFLVVAYQLLLGGRGMRALRALWEDLAAAASSSIGLACAAGAVAWLLSPQDVPALVYMTAVALAGAIAYLLILGTLFPTAFADLAAVVRRVAPGRLLRIVKTVRLPPWSRRPTSEAG